MTKIPYIQHAMPPICSIDRWIYICIIQFGCPSSLCILYYRRRWNRPFLLLLKKEEKERKKENTVFSNQINCKKSISCNIKTTDLIVGMDNSSSRPSVMICWEPPHPNTDGNANWHKPSAYTSLQTEHAHNPPPLWHQPTLMTLVP